VIEADLVGVLDADHVAGPNFLRHTLCYFDDAKVAVVQTPQDFYNLESFEHEPMSDRPFNEESVFYRVIAPGKNKWGAAFWCGTSAVIRTEALSSVGGVATETVTEDIHTTIRLNRAGWKGVYHNEVLARGLAPSDAVQYMLQRNRWAAGAMQVLRDENPLLVSGLTLGQRLGFATTLFGWFDSWRTSTFIVLPIVVLFTGASPIDAPGYLYGPFFLSAFILQFFALRLLARGHYPPLLSLLFEVLRMPAVLPATLAIFGRKGARSFRVTPKGQGGGRKRVPVPLLLTGLALASAGAILWFAATAAGLTFVQYSEFPAVIGSLLFASVNLALLLAAIHRIRETRFAGERRASVRFDVRLRGHLGGVPCEVEDISLTGAKAFLARGRTFSSDRAALEIDLGEEAARLYVDVLRQTVGLGRTEIALQFRPAQRAAIGNLALRLLNSEDEYSYVGGSAAAPAA
jgi:cellulose synthase (UDP-forming)